MAALLKPVGAWRTCPSYSISQAAKIAGTHPINVRRWLYGVVYTEGSMKPVFGQRDETAVLSFVELSEIIIVARFRKRNVKLNDLIEAHGYARDYLGIEYPFAHIKLKTDGANVLAVYEKDHPKASLLAMNRRGQFTLPQEVINALELFDYEDEFVARWYPAGKNVPIVIDPRYSGGRPSIPERRLPISLLYGRWKSGEDMHYIASDYALKPDVVEEALRFAENYVV
jgi:uncharacterized protein (DUF433 family)